MKWLHPERLMEEWTKSSGYVWTIERDGDKPSLEVFHCADGVICIRQEGENVDLVTLAHGQAYDLLKALSRALETP